MFFKSVLVLLVAVLNLHVAVGASSIFSDADAMVLITLNSLLS
jgi:hypothetical protein